MIKLIRYLSILPILAYGHTNSLKEIDVTYGSSIRLTATNINYMLGSSGIKYRDNPEKQMVTAFQEVLNSDWQIESPRKFSEPSGKVLQCNSDLILKNTKNGCYLSVINQRSALTSSKMVICSYKPRRAMHVWTALCSTSK